MGIEHKNLVHLVPTGLGYSQGGIDREVEHIKSGGNGTPLLVIEREEGKRGFLLWYGLDIAIAHLKVDPYAQVPMQVLETDGDPRLIRVRDALEQRYQALVAQDVKDIYKVLEHADMERQGRPFKRKDIL